LPSAKERGNILSNPNEKSDEYKRKCEWHTVAGSVHLKHNP